MLEICDRQGWTYSDYMSQPPDFIDDLWTLITEKNKEEARERKT